MARLREQWRELEKDQYGAVVRRKGDYSVRLGICHQPVSERELYVFTICHKVRPSRNVFPQHLQKIGLVSV